MMKAGLDSLALNRNKVKYLYLYKLNVGIFLMDVLQHKP